MAGVEAEEPPAEVEEKASQPPGVIWARANPKAEYAIQVPPCPYTDETNIENGIPCYIPGCTLKQTSWGLH